MGADGAIRLFNINKFERKFGIAESKRFLELVKDSQSYVHHFKVPDSDTVIRVLTLYRGDNIYCDHFLGRLQNTLDGSKWGDQLERWDYDAIEEQGFDRLLLDLKELTAYLYTECYIDNWEVWT